MKKKNKYVYVFNLWTNYGNGWEIESQYDKKETTYSQVKKDAAEYRLTGAQTRITEGRIPNVW